MHLPQKRQSFLHLTLYLTISIIINILKWGFPISHLLIFWALMVSSSISLLLASGVAYLSHHIVSCHIPPTYSNFKAYAALSLTLTHTERPGPCPCILRLSRHLHPHRFRGPIHPPLQPISQHIWSR